MGVIRLLLAIAVLNSHFPVSDLDLPIVDGHEAVLTFFAISGFFMALILDTTYRTPRHFYLSRVLTLYPMYVMALLLSMALLISMDIHPLTTLADFRKIIADPVSFLALCWSSACILGQELLFSFGPGPHGGLQFLTSSRNGLCRFAPMIQAWSLSLEMLFYLLAPFLVRWRSRSLAALAGASLVLKFIILASDWGSIVLFKRFFPAELWLFVAGILAYRFFKTLPTRIRPTDYGALLVLVAAILFADLVPTNWEPIVLPGIGLATMPFIFRAMGRLKFDRTLGKITYPFYLVHFSVIAIFEASFEEPFGWDILLTTLVLSIIMYHLFTPGAESMKRILALRSRGNRLIQEKSFTFP